MAAEVHQFTAVIPANTAIAAPHVVPLTLDNRVVVMLDIEVPPGPAGLMGFYIAHSGTQLIPLEVGQWIVWDDKEREWPVEDYPTSSGWSVVGYNLDGANGHSVIVRMHTVYPSDVTTAPPAPSVTFVTTPVPSVPVTL